MKNRYYLLAFLFSIIFVYSGCSKSSSTSTGASNDGPTYPVTATVLNPQGKPQGGALLTLKNAPSQNPKYSAYTDTSGKATIQSPAGNQVLIAKIGSAFLSEIPVVVKADSTGTNAGTVTLHQNTSVKVLVVKASAEQLEDVLRVIGYATFDSTEVDTLRNMTARDSTQTLTFLKNYTLIFSDCDGGTESAYPGLSRVYGRYVEQGGKIYGGHYNFYNLDKVWQPFFTKRDYQGVSSKDSISIIDTQLQGFIGFSIAKWNATDSRALSGYEKFSDLPTASKVYGVIYGTSPAVGVIVENYLGTGKYLWTDYHNQDIKTDPKLVKIVQYFLLNL
ncbi:MAG: carboxypeptidase-like regulatory domain-containing protein [Bacteroidota bacterium]|nr:carboxypeptidase-like regulatory domain-containing protein [Bacteroidota bacterium]